MKELEKTKRISIASVLFILIVLIALLAYKRPKHIYTIKTVNTLENLITTNYIISLDSLSDSNVSLIDVRSETEFEKGHLENAQNMYTPNILSEENTKILTNLKSANSTVVLYGATPNEALTPFMILYQLGFDNIKILAVENSYTENRLITKNVAVEKSVADVNAFINESIKKAEELSAQKVVAPPPPPKQVITVQKKKKAPAEGGC